jgi:uncharacterized protein YjbI with pentapeptide repeats
MSRCKISGSSLARVVRLSLFAGLLALGARAQNLTCPANAAPPDRNFQGQTIQRGNFAYRDLTNANFSGATLIAPFFDFANLTNAKFQGATIVDDPSNPALVADFSFARLDGACFIGAQFNGPTYFTSASLTCADFSKTDLSAGNAIFGESPLTFDRAKTNCRLAFRASVMNCEFLADWRFLDLSGADVKACSNQLVGRDLSGSKLGSVNLAGANLDGTKFVRADLSRAVLDKASLRGADLSYATLLGAHLNLANLTGANLYHAFLSNDTPSGISNAASVQHAHLKNANLSFAQLSGVDFRYSNFYGHDPAATGVCKTAPSRDKCRESPLTNYQGFTCDCAAAHGAIVRQTKFSHAYLYGVDFTSALGQGVDFSEAVLTGSNFAGAAISSDPQSGTASTFFRAFLQGSNLDGAQLKDRPNLSDAFVDFTPGGNNLYIFLDGANHNQFTCPDCEPPTGTNVCVLVNYPEPTSVPGGGTALTCPSGFIGDCGPPDPSGGNANWKSRIADLGAPPTGVPPAWYEHDATYSKAPENPNVICNGQGPDSAIVFW